MTVMERLVGSPAALIFAAAWPAAVLVPVTMERPPDEEVNATGIPAMKRLLASRTNAVMSAFSELSEGIVGVLLTSVSEPTKVPA